MSKNANNVNATTATTTTNNTTTIKKQEESTMKKATTNATTAMTAAEFKQKSYDAYLVYMIFFHSRPTPTRPFGAGIRPTNFALT